MKKLFFLIMMLCIIPFVISYSTPAGDGVNITITSRYTAPSGDQVNLTLSTGINAPDLNLTFGPAVSVFRFLGCGPNKVNTSSLPQGQNASLGIDYLCNNGTVAGVVQVKLSGALNTNWSIQVSNTSISSNLITLNTSYQTIINSLSPSTCAYIWMKANCSYVTQGPGAYEIYNIT